ncbi:hypothetical protein HHK36_031749 [Tetracentron sinense]|uniref:RNase H type-1 domain-containing protein n=1 Tax=Tetracentron sinense TaxID=13715 RepID=A0A834Y948_TETSI|nr:hypothetical protein HHK36_031749 [Tetracentron sinense]
MESISKGHASWAWKSILKARHILSQGLQWQVGNGSHINIWTDSWIGLEEPDKFLDRYRMDYRLQNVSDLITSDRSSHGGLEDNRPREQQLDPPDPSRSSISQYHDYQDDNILMSDHFILTTDGAVDAIHSMLGIGGVLSDSSGQCIMSFSELLHGDSSIIAEAQAIRSGLILASNAGVQCLVLKSYAKAIIDGINMPVNAAWEVVPLILDINQLLSSFCHVSCQYIPRALNREAHRLAKGALRVNANTVSGFVK